MPCILVVDDEAKILDIVRIYLQNCGYKVCTAGTAKEAFDVIKSDSVSLLLLDLMLPDMSGEEVCRRVRETSSLPIIMMTAKVDEESIVNGLGIGADDYVVKPFSPRQLTARVSAVLRRYGDSAAGDKTLRYGSLSVDTGKRAVFKNGSEVTLTPNEYGILTLLMSRPGRIFTRDEIISHVKTGGYDGYDRTVDSHIKNLRQKIEDDPRAPLFIATVYGAGYRFEGGKARR